MNQITVSHMDIRYQIYQGMLSLFHDKFFNNVAEIGGFKRQITTNPYIVYLHFPFCQSSCKWCIYRKTVHHEHIDRYCETVVKEIDMWAQDQVLDGKKLSNMYIGGGTPTLMPIHHLEKIMNKIYQNFPAQKDIQVCIDANPRSVRPDYLEAYKSLGINRISIGAQSFQENVLKEMKRQTSLAEIEKSIEMVKEKGIEYNIDIMVGFDCQTTEMVIADIQKAMDYGAMHISIYPMTRETMIDGKRDLEYEAKVEEMYQAGRRFLIDNGFIQYSAEGFYKSVPCNYFVDMWSSASRDIVAFGAGSFGWIGFQKYYKQNLMPYMESVQNNKLPFGFYQLNPEEEVTHKSMVALLALKVDRQVFKDAYQVDPAGTPLIKMLEEIGVVTIDDRYIRSTEKGIYDFAVISGQIYFVEIADVLRNADVSVK